MTFDEIKSFLDEKADYYNNPNFIDSDPIQIPHQFSLKEDIEISGFLSATIAWGNRKSIITNANRMMQIMGNTPYDFVMSFTANDLERIENFVHRTFNAQDFSVFLKGLRHIYQNYGGLENAFSQNVIDNSLQPAISKFKQAFFEIEHQNRTQKHISDPMKNSAAKRINMFLRWMVRNDNRGVDFGIWKSVSPSVLSCPLDVHSGGVGRKLGLIQTKLDNSKSLAELDSNLRLFDAEDPVKYDFALFGLGLEGFAKDK